MTLFRIELLSPREKASTIEIEQMLYMRNI